MMFFLAYWRQIGTGLLLLGVVGWIGFDHFRLAYYEAWTHHYEAVQKRNGEAISAQNRAIRLMWAKEKISAVKEKKAEVVATKIMTSAVNEGKKPIRFTQNGTCGQDVMETLQRIREIK